MFRMYNQISISKDDYSKTALNIPDIYDQSNLISYYDNKPTFERSMFPYNGISYFSFNLSHAFQWVSSNAI